VALLLLNRADRNKPSAVDGNTALHLAAAHGHVKVVELLLRDANSESNPIHTANTSGLTPIHVAAREGHLDVLNSMFSAKKRSKDAESVVNTDKEDKHSLSGRPVTSPVDAPPCSRRLHPRPRPRRRSTVGLA
jgi:ankyrin repeat protein